MARTLRVHSTWRGEHEIEVPDDLDGEIPEDLNDLNGWPAELLEQVDTSTVELVDWEVTER